VQRLMESLGMVLSVLRSITLGEKILEVIGGLGKEILSLPFCSILLPEAWQK
jgi:hypothetical protein